MAASTPSNSTLASPWDIVSVIGKCDASRPTQMWHFKNTTSPVQNLLYLEQCDATNPNQRWNFPGSAGNASSFLQNVGTGQCVDSSLQWDPGMLGACKASTSSQQWTLQTNSNHTVSGAGACLDVYDFSVSVTRREPAALGLTRMLRRLPCCFVCVAGPRR